MRFKTVRCAALILVCALSIGAAGKTDAPFYINIKNSEFTARVQVSHCDSSSSHDGILGAISTGNIQGLDVKRLGPWMCSKWVRCHVLATLPENQNNKGATTLPLDMSNIPVICKLEGAIGPVSAGGAEEACDRMTANQCAKAALTQSQVSTGTIPSPSQGSTKSGNSKH